MNESRYNAPARGSIAAAEGRRRGSRPLLRSGFARCLSLIAVFAGALLPVLAHGETPAPPRLVSPAGEAFVPERFDNRLLLVNFWASWCLPCRIEMPDLDELQTRYDPAEFTVLGVAADEVDPVVTYLQAVPVRYPVFVGDADQVFAWSEQLGNLAVVLPFSALLDESGSVRWVKTGGRISIEELTPIIDRLLQAEKSAKEER